MFDFAQFVRWLRFARLRLRLPVSACVYVDFGCGVTLRLLIFVRVLPLRLVGYRLHFQFVRLDISRSVDWLYTTAVPRYATLIFRVAARTDYAFLPVLSPFTFPVTRTRLLLIQLFGSAFALRFLV